MKRVRMHAEARAELFAAAEHYEKLTPGAGKRMRLEFAHLRERVRTAPLQGSPYLYGTRRFLFDRFPYSNVYLMLDGSGYIIAIPHHRRRPGYWRKRLKEVE